jgi:hypothetical protein
MTQALLKGLVADPQKLLLKKGPSSSISKNSLEAFQSSRRLKQGRQPPAPDPASCPGRGLPPGAAIL